MFRSIDSNLLIPSRDDDKILNNNTDFISPSPPLPLVVARFNSIYPGPTLFNFFLIFEDQGAGEVIIKPRRSTLRT